MDGGGLGSRLLAGGSKEVDNVGLFGCRSVREHRGGRDGGDLRQVDAASAIEGLDLVEAKDLIEELVGCRSTLGRGEVVVGDLGGTANKGRDGQEDAKSLVDSVLDFDNLGQGDRDREFEILGHRCLGLLGLEVLSRAWLGRRSRCRSDLDVAEIKVEQVVEVGLVGGGSLGVDASEMGEDVTLNESAMRACTLDLLEISLADALLLDEMLNGGQQRVLVLVGIVASGLGALLLDGLRLGGSSLLLGRLSAGLFLRLLLGLLGGDLEGVDIVASLCNDTDARSNLHSLAAIRSHDFDHDTVILGLDVHAGLVGLDLEQHITSAKRLSLLDLPGSDIALSHGRREGGHGEVLGGEASCRGGEACMRGCVLVGARQKGPRGDFQHQRIDIPRALADRAVTARADALQAAEREAIVLLD